MSTASLVEISAVMLSSCNHTIFVTHKLRFYAHTPSYEFCRRMELLLACLHRIVALVELFSWNCVSTCKAKLIPSASPIFFARSKCSGAI